MEPNLFEFLSSFSIRMKKVQHGKVSWSAGSDVVVNINDDYWISDALVCQSLFKEITGCNPSWPRGIEHQASPVNNVNWLEAIAFCWQLNRSNCLEQSTYQFMFPTRAQHLKYYRDYLIENDVGKLLQWCQAGDVEEGKTEFNESVTVTAPGTAWTIDAEIKSSTSYKPKEIKSSDLGFRLCFGPTRHQV